MILDYLTLIAIATHQPRCGVQHVYSDSGEDMFGDVEHAACCIGMDEQVAADQGSPVSSAVQLYLGTARRCSVCTEMVVEYYHAP